MKKILVIIIVTQGMIIRCLGQSTIYSENFGTGTNFPAGWTATTGTNTWAPSTGSPSSGYSGASGGTNIVATNGSTLNTYYLTYSNNLSTVGYTGITVLWGARRTSTFSNAVTFEWSSDGSTWNPVIYIQVSSNSTWALVNAGTVISLPAGAEGIPNLRLRWGYTQISGSGTCRIDDVVVQGNLPTQVITYTWQGPDGGDWSFPANWNPSRTVPSTNDILQFSDGSSKAIINVPSQTIGQIYISNLTTVTLHTTGSSVLFISGGPGDDFTLGEHSHFNLDGPDALTLALITGTTATISGEITFTGGGHKLTAVDAGSIVFMTGSIFTAGTGFTGNPFGTTSLNSIVFQSGSTFITQSGNNPFGAASPNSVVVFQPGSLYIHQQSGSLSLSGRTFGDFELNYPSTFSQSGSGAASLGNLTITSGTLNFNLTGPSSGTHSIKGNITIASGQALNFNPASPGIVTFNGTSSQLISGDGTLTNSANSSWIILNNAGITNDMNNPVTLNGNLTISTGSFIIHPFKTVVMNGTLTINP